MTTFSAKVDDWARKSEARVDAVRRQSVQELTEVILTPKAKGGNLRVDTGFLRSSWLGSTAAMPKANREKPSGDNFDWDSASYAVTIANWKAGQTFYAGFGANYAAAREYGARGQPADLMVKLGVQRWQQIVEQVAREMRSRAGG